MIVHRITMVSHKMTLRRRTTIAVHRPVGTVLGGIRAHVGSELHDNIFTEGQPRHFCGKADDGFLEDIVEVGGDEPVAR